MTRGRCGRVLAVGVLTLVVSVAVFDVPVTAGSNFDVHAVDALMLRLMSTYGVPGAAAEGVRDG